MVRVIYFVIYGFVRFGVHIVPWEEGREGGVYSFRSVFLRNYSMRSATPAGEWGFLTSICLGWQLSGIRYERWGIPIMHRRNDSIQQIHKITLENMIS